MKGDFDNIPIVSLAGLADDANSGERSKTVAALKEALEVSGFAYLSDHGVSEDLVERMRQQNVAFHDQPMEEKLKLKINAFHRGYMPMSTSTIVTSSVAKVTKPNRSESLMFMHEVPEDAPYAGEPLQGPNQFPENLPEVRSTALEYMTQMTALGPQTNIALALRRAPEIAKQIDRIVFMGGGFFEGGNMSPAAEYNILVDPEAARIVLGSGVPITAVPLDCTHKAPAPLGWSQTLADHGTPVMRACAGMMEFFERYGNAKYGTATRPLHDAIAVSALLWPELFDGRLCPVDIECAGELTTGMTVVDWLRQTGKTDNCLWLNACHDPAEVYARMEKALAKL